MQDDATPKRRLTDRDPDAAAVLNPERIDQVEERVEEHVEGDDGLHAEHRQEMQEARDEHKHDFAEIVEENRLLRADVADLTSAVQKLNLTLSSLVTKNQMQRTVESRLADVERSTNRLVDRGAVKLRSEQRRAGVRQRALIRSQVAASLFITIVGMLVAVTVLDVHNHRAHVEPVEQRLDEIEELIREVDVSIAEDRLPNLNTNPYPTSQLTPLAPAPQQTHAPAGWSLYAAGIVGMLLTTVEWRTARKELAATGQPMDPDDPSPEPPPPPLGPLERRRAKRDEALRTEE